MKIEGVVTAMISECPFKVICNQSESEAVKYLLTTPFASKTRSDGVRVCAAIVYLKWEPQMSEMTIHLNRVINSNTNSVVHATFLAKPRTRTTSTEPVSLG